MQLSQRRFLRLLASSGENWDDLLVKFNDQTVEGWRLNEDSEFECDGCTVTERDYATTVSFMQSRTDYI